MKARSVAALLVISSLPTLLGISGGEPADIAYWFTQRSAPHVETVIGWMLKNTPTKLAEAARGTSVTRDDAIAYFAMARRPGHGQMASDDSRAGRAGTALLVSDLPAQSQLGDVRPGVELLIQEQVTDALRRNGLSYRVGALDLLFPPVLFRFEAPPNVLVVSPRDRIERLGTVLLDSQLSLDEAERLEDFVSADGYSGLVTPIGGLGVYPSMVPYGTDLRLTLRTVAHEWAHQFLALRPLGWRYAFGAERDSRMVTINETVAEIVGREIGDQLYRSCYGDALPEQSSPLSGDDGFRRRMREIRMRVDAMLAQGRIDEAESFMESSRQELARSGYFIRKINQAYFAFNGSYADEPAYAGGVQEDIAGQLHQLRNRCESLGEFVWMVSSVGSYDDFRRLAGSR